MGLVLRVLAQVDPGGTGTGYTLSGAIAALAAAIAVVGRWLMSRLDKRDARLDYLTDQMLTTVQESTAATKQAMTLMERQERALDLERELRIRAEERGRPTP